MLTQCPACSAMFRLRAADLAAAHGFVECGACGETFNALLRLADELPARAAPADAAPIRQSERSRPARAETGTASVLAEAAEPVPPAAGPEAPRAAPTAPHASSAASRSPHAAASHGSEPARRGPVSIASSPEVDLDGMPPIRAAEPVAEGAGEAPRVELRLDDVPAILREDLARLARRPGRAGRAWAALAVLLLCALGAQLAWTHRAALLARYPEARPPLERMCDLLDCRVDVPRDSNGIELVAREVRTHPEYAHTLLVNANIANRGDSLAAYPVLELALFDASGAHVGVRRFTPAEYLDDSIDVAAGLPPGRTVYIVLEIVDETDRAAGFEFDFY